MSVPVPAQPAPPVAPCPAREHAASSSFAVTHKRVLPSACSRVPAAGASSSPTNRGCHRDPRAVHGGAHPQTGDALESLRFQQGETTFAGEGAHRLGERML